MRLRLPLPVALVVLVIGSAAPSARGQVFDATADWSNVSNPNGVWTYREASNALPAVASWQSSLGGWSVAQPGWARSENGNNRLPFWFRSNGSETFAHDFLAGDVVVHSHDGVNGVGNGLANLLWTSPVNGSVSITGNTWIGRDIGRSNRWEIYHGNTLLSSGDTFSGDPYSRASPFDFASGSGGAGVLTNIPVTVGDTLSLQIVATAASGEFQGIHFTVTVVPEPTSLALVAMPAVAWWIRRRQSGR